MTLIKQSELKLISQWNWYVVHETQLFLIGVILLNRLTEDNLCFLEHVLFDSLHPLFLPQPLPKCCKQTCVYAHDGSSPAEVRNNTRNAKLREK